MLHEWCVAALAQAACFQAEADLVVLKLWCEDCANGLIVL